jgi:hypothetical protein
MIARDAAQIYPPLMRVFVWKRDSSRVETDWRLDAVRAEVPYGSPPAVARSRNERVRVREREARRERAFEARLAVRERRDRNLIFPERRRLWCGGGEVFRRSVEVDRGFSPLSRWRTDADR